MGFIINMEKGNLYIIATPIGNLSDITLRAIETLKRVDIVLSEDTRETDKIFKKYEINKPQLSYRDQNHNFMLPKIIEMLEKGSNLALISDSGTPLISDPGYKLVRDVIKRDMRLSQFQVLQHLDQLLYLQDFQQINLFFLVSYQNLQEKEVSY